MESKPTFVYRDGMLSDARYVEWLSDVKTRFHQSRIKASIRVNTSIDEALFYVNKVADEGWSRSVLENNISTKLYFDFLSMTAKYDERDLEEALVPTLRSFCWSWAKDSLS